MVKKNSHICVCICTYKRPRLLKRLLLKLQNQKTDGLFTYSIVVVDNDHELSAKDIILEIKKKSTIAIDYYIEPEKNVAFARNRAVQNANGNFICFIDDDEFPFENWLFNLYKTCNEYNASGVLGPVKPHFEQEPPKWIVKGNLFDKPYYKTGTILRWENTRTGNVLIRKNIFQESGNMFNPEFRHGEDKDYFRRMTEKGYIFVWCNEAPVYETQLPDRFKLSYFLRRALLRGSVSLRHQSNKLLPILKSLIAFLLYTFALPILLLIGYHIFIKYLIKDCDHIGKLMAACGINVEKYLL